MLNQIAKILTWFKDFFTGNLGQRTVTLLRYGIVILAIFMFSAKIMSNIIETAWYNAENWNSKAMEMLSRTRDIIPERGDILASDGSILATNLNFYTLRIDYQADRLKPDTLKKYLPTLSECLAKEFPPKTAKEWSDYLSSELSKDKKQRSRSYLLLRNLSHSDVNKIKAMPFFNMGSNRSGLVVERDRRRSYPYGEMARRSIGRVGQTKESDERHGISGLERALDTLLYGRTGITEKKVLTHGIVDWARQEAVPGYDIVTTIDINMQDIVENELNAVLTHTDADWGLAVLMDVHTGDIKAISNLEKSPKDPGTYIEAMNRAVQGYEPGSVVKTLSMMIALDDGCATDLDRVITTGRYVYEGRPITDSHATTSLKVSEVLEQSSNIAMTKIITERFGSNPGEFYTRVKESGFLDPLNIGISGERTPVFDSVPSNRGGRLVLSRQCFGYATEIPPMHTLALYNAIANDGKFVRPRLVQRLINKQLGVDSTLAVSYVRERVCSQQTAETLRSLLRRVVWGDHGTARTLRNNMVAIAGKTGTSYMVEDGAYSHKKRLSFCGFFPADNPQYSCIVLTCNPRQNWFGAAMTSGQVLRNVALKLYSRGLLGDHEEYRTDTPSTDVPRLAASTDKDTRDMLSASLSVRSPKTYRKPTGETRKGHVPDVRGLDLRSAVSALESAGYNVAPQGSGIVRSMAPAPSTQARPGTRVTINLR